MSGNEWDGTPWAGTVALIEAAPVRSGPPSRAAHVVAKAAVGWESVYTTDRIPVPELSRSPLRRMRAEQALYWSNPWIRSAENAVSRRVAGLPWHLEDEVEDEVEDETPNPALRTIRDLLEKPQAALPIEERQAGIDSWTNLSKITSRHLGLCGMTHWFLDSLDAAGIPSAILYINPARLFPVTTAKGQLVSWILDPEDDYGRGGMPLKRREVLTFYLEPPDAGAISTGLIQAAYLKAQVTTLADQHAAYVLATGGRLAGLISPKEGAMQDEQYGVAVRELRNAAEASDSAKRLTVLRGPIDFNRTAGTLEELTLTDLEKMNREDILAVWGVPASQAAIGTPAGLNSGETKKYDEAVLYQGAVHDRVTVIRETIQLGLLDRFKATGVAPELEIEEPSFDDKAPQYELASQAKDQPLTRNERRALLDLDPLPEYGPDGEPLGLAIDLPALLVTVGQGEEPERGFRAGRFTKAPAPKPEPTISVLPPSPPLLPGPASGRQDAQAEAPAKARTAPPRETLLRRFEPMLRRAVAGVLAEQGEDIAGRVADRGEHLARKPGDRSAWWDPKRWDGRLLAAMKQALAGLASNVTARIGATLGPAPAKADPFTEAVLNAILGSVASRVTGINATTRDAIADVIEEAFTKGLSPAEVAQLVRDATAFDAARAELIARTETAQVYNEAAVRSYREYGVTHLEAIDGDEDEECAARNGQTFTVDEALEITDHPNGTLDWIPVLA